MNEIIIQGLTKQYGDILAVSDLNLQIGDGELFALLGVNGAGKSTTIRMLSGLTTPTAGDATLCGFSLSRERQKVKSVLAVSPQETAVAPNLTVRENLRLMAGLHNVTEDGESLLRRFRLEAVAARRAKTLSGGWQRRLSIAMALVSRPRILFLDEPTLGLDVLARQELWDEIRKLKGEVTMVLTTHYLEEAEALSDRIGILRSGHLCAVGTAREIQAQTGAATFADAFVQLAREG